MYLRNILRLTLDIDFITPHFSLSLSLYVHNKISTSKHGILFLKTFEKAIKLNLLKHQLHT